MIKEARSLNTVFRVCIFITFAMSSVMSSMIIYYMVSSASAGDKNDQGRFAEMFDRLMSVFRIYDILIAAAAVCLVLSILQRHKATVLSLVGRSWIIGSSLVNLISGRPFISTYIRVMDIISNTDENIYDLTNSKAIRILISSGIPEDEANDMIAVLDSNGSIKSVFIAFLVTQLVFFILTLTSVSNLRKKDAAGYPGSETVNGTVPVSSTDTDFLSEQLKSEGADPDKILK